jgi:membrane-associated protease RseP (regulator of RpoE activity)
MTRNRFGMVLLLTLAASLPAWAAQGDQNQDFFSELGEPGSGTTVYHVGGSYLGIDMQDITGDRVSQLKLQEERGAEVMMVDQDAPAGKAGMKEHDVILEFNGTKVEGCEQLRRLIHETPSGRTVTLGISRDGQPLTLQVQLADREKAMAHVKPFVMPDISVMPHVTVRPEFDMPSFDINIHSVRSGLQIENLTPQLGEFFGVKGGDGVLVRSVDKGSAGETAGLKAGDVIVRVGNEKVANRTDWNMVMRHASGKITLGVVREKREQSFSLTVPERSKDHSQSWGLDDDFKFEDFSTDFDRNKLNEIRAAARDSAARLREQLRQELAQNRESLQKTRGEVNRQLKPQLDELRRSLEEMRLELQKTLHEL